MSGLDQLYGTLSTPAADGAPKPDGTPALTLTGVSPGPPPHLVQEAARLLSPEAAALRAAGAAPVAYALDALKDGGRLLSRTTVQNGIPSVHAVYLPPGTALPGGAAPISYWEAPRWTRGSAPEAGRPGPVDQPPPPDSPLAPGALADFTVSRGPWLTAFLGHVRRLAAPEGTAAARAPHLVLVEEDSSLVARWIALACAVLPDSYARELTFTTYSALPWSGGRRIVGTRPGTVLAPQDPLEGEVPAVLNCTLPPPSAAPATDLWAEVAALLWRAGSPGIVAAARPALDAGALCLAALAAGVPLPAQARTAALELLGADTPVPEGSTPAELTRALCAAPPETAQEAAAVARLHARLEGRTPLAVSAPAAASLLGSLVHGQLDTVPVLRSTALTEELRARTASALGPALRAATADPATAPRRAVALLLAAAVLDVDCGAATLDTVAARLAPALTVPRDTGESAATEGGPAEDDVLPYPGALRELPELCAALLPRLEEYAAREPLAAEALLARTGIPLDASVRPVPHLRMCAEAARVRAGAPDGVSAWEALLRASRPSWSTHPALLRTALRLVWDRQPPSTYEMTWLLHTAGSDGHRAAGTWQDAVRVALGTPASEPYDLELAPLLLRFFPEQLTTREHAALSLLGLAHGIGTGDAKDWAEHALRLRRAAEPLEPDILSRVHHALAEALLRSPGTPEGELYGLAHSGDPELVAAYGAAARSEEFRTALRAAPALVAGCFVDWTAHSAADPDWRRESAALLDEVLRPAVRGLPGGAVREVEEHLTRTGQHRADAFRTWNRPGALGRLGRRLTGGGRG